ncbi:MAG: GSCFA domain-containing protein [Capnocytophaga sp.]|nr:GSCFA domain-containing protein [Capnocytophaga sp.]
MKFRTEINILPQLDCEINYHSDIVCVGSCFSEHIARKLKWYEFRTTANPLGILFHPQALEKIFSRALDRIFFTENDFFSHNELWHSYELHSQMSGRNLSETVGEANVSLQVLDDALRHCSHLFITLGTAWIYELPDGTSVANCHKIPQKYFQKRLLSVEEIEVSLRKIISQMRKYNPETRIIFTISPVRHLKDGFTENQRSKAHLITALHQVIGSDEAIRYFPSYELLMDELRDYRFYAGDMLHPSEMAVDYIWERFCDCYTTNETRQEMKNIQQIKQGLAHRPFNPDTEAHRIFSENLHRKITDFKTKYPHLGGSF